MSSPKNLEPIIKWIQESNNNIFTFQELLHNNNKYIQDIELKKIIHLLNIFIFNGFIHFIK